MSAVLLRTSSAGGFRLAGATDETAEVLYMKGHRLKSQVRGGGGGCHRRRARKPALLAIVPGGFSIHAKGLTQYLC